MMARILQLLLALQLLLVLGLARLANLWLHNIFLASLAALGLLLAGRLFISLNNFRLSWHYRGASPTAPRLTPLRRCRMVATEFGATMLSSSWHMAWPRVTACHAGTGLPVLMVHGYASNRGYWTACAAIFRQNNIPYDVLDLEPVNAALDEYVASLEHAISALCASSGSAQLILLGHSMGGLVMRAYLRTHGSARIARAITLGTPHHGTTLANFVWGENALQMARHADQPSVWLTALAAQEDGAQRALLTSIFSRDDNIVMPATSAYLPGAKNIALDGVGHVALGSERRVLQCVLDEIRLANSAALAA